jgi:hypothetical protein
MELWAGCVAGALSDRDYLDKLAAAGFADAAIEVTRIYRAEDARELLAGQGPDVEALAAEVDGKFVAAFVRATKPAAGAAQSVSTGVAASASSCCAPSCCGGG